MQREAAPGMAISGYEVLGGVDASGRFCLGESSCCMCVHEGYGAGVGFFTNGLSYI